MMSELIQDRYNTYDFVSRLYSSDALLEEEHSMFELIQLLKSAYSKIGCFPKEIQIDNRLEFNDKVRRNPGSKTAK